MPSLPDAPIRPTGRSLLLAAVVCSLVLAGCTTGDQAGPLSTTESPETTTANATTTVATTTAATTTAETTSAGMGADGWYRSYRFRASQTSLASLAERVARTPEELEPEREPLARRGASDGSVTVAHAGDHGPLDGLDYVRTNGTYYAVGSEQVAVESRTAFDFGMEGPISAENSEYSLQRAKREAVAAENLSAPDSAVFFEGLPPAEERPEPGEGSFVTGYFHFYATDEAPANATFVDGETHFVAYDGAYYAVEFDEKRTLDRTETRYTFDVVASNQSAFASLVGDRFVTNLSTSDLGDRDRELVRDVVENGSIFWEGNASETPAAIGRRAELLEELAPKGSVAYVEIDGRYYRITVMQVME